VADVVDRPEAWPVHDSEIVWDGGAPFAVRLDRISAPDLPDEQFGRLVIDHPGAVVVLAVDDRDRVLVLEQYRHPTARRFVELPAGLLDQPGEDPLAAAQRELREEGQLRADSWAHLVTSHPSPGLSSERIEIFVARELTAVSAPDDFEPVHEEADMTVSWAPLSDLVEGVLDGRLTDGPLALAVLAHRFRGDAGR
jgi:8-oxo-dGDP phosphatase